MKNLHLKLRFLVLFLTLGFVSSVNANIYEDKVDTEELADAMAHCYSLNATTGKKVLNHKDHYVDSVVGKYKLTESEQSKTYTIVVKSGGMFGGPSPKVESTLVITLKMPQRSYPAGGAPSDPAVTVNKWSCEVKKAKQ
ncbi:MAG: hypothetical protein QE271_05195 [Bacteriovoracaceae bacterium]|nr:hypothetical protein [Bacteriovoracaceae bacterium]